MASRRKREDKGQGVVCGCSEEGWIWDCSGNIETYRNEDLKHDDRDDLKQSPIKHCSTRISAMKSITASSMYQSVSPRFTKQGDDMPQCGDATVTEALLM